MYVLNVSRSSVVACSDVTGTIVTLKSGAEMVMPGDNTTLTVELGENVAMAPGMRCVSPVNVLVYRSRRRSVSLPYCADVCALDSVMFCTQFAVLNASVSEYRYLVRVCTFPGSRFVKVAALSALASCPSLLTKL